MWFVLYLATYSALVLVSKLSLCHPRHVKINLRIKNLMAIDRVEIHSLVPTLLANDSQEGDA